MFNHPGRILRSRTDFGFPLRGDRIGRPPVPRGSGADEGAARVWNGRPTMRIDPRFAAAPTGAAAAPRRPEGGPAFALGQAPATTTSAAATPAASLAGLDAILTLQTNADTPEERRRRATRRGHDLLDGLDRLKASLIMGRVSTRDLQAIAGRLSQRSGDSGDPRLDGLIADIELRAAVELAKLSVSRAA